MIKKKKIKNKNVPQDLLLMYCFDFTYAGKAHIFLHKRRNQYELVIQGVNIVEDTYCFAPHVIKRYVFEKLYTAIKGFNITVSIVLNNNMDWYKPELFESSVNIYDELFIKDF